MTKKRYYKKGERLEGLKNDIKFILENEHTKANLFMTKEHYNKFAEKIKQPIIDLHSTLLGTVIDEDSLEVKAKKVSAACKDAIEFLKLNIKDDLERNFYEEKLKLYDGIYLEFIRNNLIKAYPAYSDILNSISYEYENLKKSTVFCDFPKYIELIRLYKNMIYGLNQVHITHCFCPNAIQYITHTSELLMEEVQSMLSSEFFKQETNQFRFRRIRKIIYMLKTELNLNLDE